MMSEWAQYLQVVRGVAGYGVGRRSADSKGPGGAERARIADALKKTGGNRLRAAKLLKVSRASLYNKLREYNIREG